MDTVAQTARSLSFFVVPVLVAGDGAEEFGTWFRCQSLDDAVGVCQSLAQSFVGLAILKGYERPGITESMGGIEAPYEFLAKFGEVPEHLLRDLTILGLGT